MPETDIGQKVKYFYDKWKELNYRLASEQKDEIGKLYMKHILGLDDKTIDAFLVNLGAHFAFDSSLESLKADTLVGHMHGGIAPKKGDYNTFWTKVAEISPGEYSQEDIDFLIKNDDFAASWGMLCYLDFNEPLPNMDEDTFLKQYKAGKLSLKPYLRICEKSKVIHRLQVNAHVFK